MRRLWIFLLWVTLATAEVVPGLYVVELGGEPAMTSALKQGRREAAAVRRVQIRSEQQRVRTALAQRRATVLTTVDTVANALVVRAPGEAGAGLAGIAGVAHVYPVYEARLELDHALPLHHVPDAWRLVGGLDQAGAGVKIAIIDTGIDRAHPGFQDSSLTMPEGFPKVNRDSDLEFTNSKIIVARDYSDLLGGSGESSASDSVGHGTAVAMAAAGVPNTGPFGEITGVAPKAFLGSYKVFSGDGRGTTRTDVILKAMDDAVADGMDVINLSLGVTPAPRPEDDVIVQAVERAAQAGVLLVTSAGNEGPDPNTLSSPGGAPSVISVGASWNDRLIAATATVGGGSPYLAVPSAGTNPAMPIEALLSNVSTLDDNGLACQGLPEASLTGTIAFILRGDCTFEVKLNNARAAGAVAALVYTNETQPDPVTMAVGTATLPAVMVSYTDGIAIRRQLEEDPSASATLRFHGAPFPVDPGRVAVSSSRGPDERNAIKPDLLAVGVEVYTATQKNNASGVIFSPSGYVIADGTSFSSPLVAGAAAVLKAAHPGLQTSQYRSLLINSASPLADKPVAVQQTGAGVLDLAAALETTAAAFPTELSFGAGGGTADLKGQLTVTNVGSAADTFSISILPSNDGTMPSVSANTLPLEPGASATISMNWNISALPAGAYEGFLAIRGTRTEVETRVPYWYAVTGAIPRNLTVLNAPDSGTTGGNVSILIRMTDQSGVILRQPEPQVSVVAGDGFISSVRLIEDQYPGVYLIRARLGLTPGSNVFRLEAGEANREVSIQGNASFRLGN